MINVLVYALPNRSGGGLSVIENLYYDLRKNAEQIPDIHWFFIMGIDALESTSNITVKNEEGALKTWLHRYYFNKVKLKQFVQEKDIKAIVSINMGVIGIDIPHIISFHNVLPFYPCDKEVFDDYRGMIKQWIINREILKSVKEAEYVIVPSRWVKEKLVSECGLKEERICVSPIALPEIQELADTVADYQAGDSHRHEFIYPASGFPYKNHRVIVEAVKILQAKGIENYRVRFSGITSAGKTIKDIQSDIVANHLPIELYGDSSKKELVEVYKNGTLVFPSKIETDGFPLLESMACGGYILAADLPYAREALEHYSNYALFAPDNAVELANLMVNAMENKMRKDAADRIVNFERSKVLVPMIRKIANNNLCRNE